jgi:hypothetical protein
VLFSLAFLGCAGFSSLGSSYSLNSSADQELSIGFVTGNLDKSQMPAPPSGPGGGASRPPQDIDMQEIQEMSYPAKLWIKKIHLNVNQ